MNSTGTKKIGMRTALAYGMGSLGNNIVYAFVTTYLLVFYTDVFGIAAAAVGTLFFIARIWDAVFDPIMGIIVDNTKSKLGKFRVYLLFAPIGVALFTILMFFNPSLSNTAKLVWAYVTYILWGMSFTAMDVPYWSMSAALTQDPYERTKVVMVPRTLAVVGFLIVNVLTLPLVSMTGSYLNVAIMYGLSAVVLTWFTFATVRERISVPRTHTQTVKSVVTLFNENKPLKMLIFAMLLVETVNTIRFSFTIYYLKYNLNAENLIPMFLGLYIIVTIIGSVIAPFISRRTGKKNAAIYGNIVNCISCIGMFFTGYNSFLPVIIWCAIGAMGYGVANIAQTSMIADCVEYGEWKTGNRAEGMVFSTNIFKTKLASAIGGAIGAYTLSFIGYIPNAVQSTYTLNMMHAVFTLIPGALSLLATWPLSKYDLTEAHYETILKELDDRRAQA